MSRTRWWTAVGIVGVLALAAGLLIWRDRSTTAPTTNVLAATTTTTTTVVTTTSVATATTTEEQRLAEVEQILTDLWFGWFEAIYRKDADALWQIVATTPFHDAGVRAMSNLEFDAAPSQEALEVQVDDILLDRDDCLVVFNTASVAFLTDDPTETSVSVMWPDEYVGWRFATTWVYANDLWLADCDEVVREETP